MKKIILAIAITTASFTACAEKSGVSHNHQKHHMHHDSLEIAENEAAPEISLSIQPDAMSGWNLEIVTENFEFAPKMASKSHVAGKGHAHLYVDGVKIGRVYSNWVHLNNLSEGEHRIKVTLNSNDHRDYSVNGQVVGSEIVIVKK